MIKIIVLFFALSWEASAAIEEDVLLPGENALGEVSTGCDQGRNNNEPRRSGKPVDVLAGDDDEDDGGKTIGL